jgi:hypothetical protein
VKQNDLTKDKNTGDNPETPLTADLNNIPCIFFCLREATGIREAKGNQGNQYTEARIGCDKTVTNL